MFERISSCKHEASANELLKQGWRLIGITPAGVEDEEDFGDFGPGSWHPRVWYHFGFPRAIDAEQTVDQASVVRAFLQNMDPDALYAEAAELEGENFVGNVLEVLRRHVS